MDKLRDLARKFRLPDTERGTAHWINQDLTGSTHNARFDWDHQEGYIKVQTSIDGLESAQVAFRLTAGSLRVAESSGLPSELSGCRNIVQYLAGMFLHGDPPVSPNRKHSP